MTNSERTKKVIQEEMLRMISELRSVGDDRRDFVARSKTPPNMQSDEELHHQFTEVCKGEVLDQYCKDIHAEIESREEDIMETKNMQINQEDLKGLIEEELTKILSESRMSQPDVVAAKLLARVIKKTKLKGGVELIGPMVAPDSIHQEVKPEDGYEYTMVQFTLKTKKERTLNMQPSKPKPKRKPMKLDFLDDEGF